MPDRPVFHADLGVFFADLRNKKGWSQRQAAGLAQRKGLATVNYQVLQRLEKGRTKNPEPDVLHALARLYELPYESLVSAFMRVRFGVSAQQVAEKETRLEPAPVEVTAPSKGAVAGRQITSDDAPVPEFVRVPVMADKIAAGQPLRVEDGRFGNYVSFRADWLRRWTDPVCVQVGPREESMLPDIKPNDLVVIDRDRRRRGVPKSDRIYAIKIDDGAALKRVEVVRREADVWLAISSDNADKNTYPTRFEKLDDSQSIEDVVIGEVVWRGQYVGGRR